MKQREAKRFKVISIFPMKNQIELKCLDSGKVYYFKYPHYQGVSGCLKVGDFFNTGVNK